MKKQIAIITGFLTFISAANAFELPNGVNAKVVKTKEENGHIIEAELANSVVFETNYGSISTKEGTNVCFYENGNVKSFFTDDEVLFSLKCGRLTLSSLYSKYNASAWPEKNLPLTFDEEGNLLSAYIPFVKKSMPKPVVETVVGEIELRNQAPVSFYSNGKLKSAGIPAKTVVKINGELTPLTANSRISFYENGNLESYTPTEQKIFYGIKTKAKEPLVFSENGKIISLVPANGEILEMGDGLSFYLENFKPVEFYESGEYKKITIDCGGKDFSYDDFRFLSKDETKEFITFEFYEDGALSKATGVNFKFKYNDIEFKAEILEIYPSGKLRSVKFSEGIPDKDKKGKVVYITRRYFDENGNITAQVSSNQILLMKDDGKTIERQIFNTGYLSAKNEDVKEVSSGIHSGTEIIFDENGKPTAYTVYENHDAIRSKNPKILLEPISK